MTIASLRCFLVGPAPEITSGEGTLSVLEGLENCSGSHPDGAIRPYSIEPKKARCLLQCFR